MYGECDLLDRLGVAIFSGSSSRRGVRQFFGERGNIKGEAAEGNVDSHGWIIFFITDVGESNDTDRCRCCC